MGEKPCLLNNIADTAAEPDGLPLGSPPLADNYLAGGGNEHTINELEQGSFAATAATEEHQGLTGIDGKAYFFNNRVMNTTVNAVCYVLKLNGRVNVI